LRNGAKVSVITGNKFMMLFIFSEK
jgi:hypothetical protein